MTREEEIRARFNTLPYATDDMKALESCCGSEGGTGIMDDFGHRIADEVLEPYLQFFIEAPDDIDYLLKQNQRMAEALKRIIHRSSLAQKQLDRREEPSNIPWDVSYFRGKTTAWNDAETIARQALEGAE